MGVAVRSEAARGCGGVGGGFHAFAEAFVAQPCAEDVVAACVVAAVVVVACERSTLGTAQRTPGRTCDSIAEGTSGFDDATFAGTELVGRRWTSVVASALVLNAVVVVVVVVAAAAAADVAAAGVRAAAADEVVVGGSSPRQLVASASAVLKVPQVFLPSVSANIYLAINTRHELHV